MLTQELLKEILHYDPETGVFTRRVATSNRFNVGSVSGTTRDSGYCAIMISRRLYLAHRLAWLYIYGCFPPACVDHINGVKNDNRLGNLRAATKIENARNIGKSKNNTSGFKGVTKIGGKWVAKCTISGRCHLLGHFDTAEGASAAYAAFAKERHGLFYSPHGV